MGKVEKRTLRETYADTFQEETVERQGPRETSKLLIS